jgi:hypothetical protein
MSGICPKDFKVVAESVLDISPTEFSNFNNTVVVENGLPDKSAELRVPVVMRGRDAEIAFGYWNWNGTAGQAIARDCEIIVAPRHHAQKAVDDRPCPALIELICGEVDMD